MKEYILNNFNPQKLIDNAAEIAALFHEYGVVVFPSLFQGDEVFERFLFELKWILDEILCRHLSQDLPSDIGEKLALLNKVQPLDGRIFTDIGTQPNKLFGFNQLKYSKYTAALIDEIFGSGHAIASPHAGDTLHFFGPGAEFKKYQLPMHQDYPYLMQSPQQVTMCLGLSKYKPHVGGLGVWEKSHQLGMLKSKKDSHGAFQVADEAQVRNSFDPFDYYWNVGDLGIFSSLLVHSSIPNESADAARAYQLFRFSKLDHTMAKAYNFYSTVYPRRGVAFEDVHQDLFCV